MFRWLQSCVQGDEVREIERGVQSMAEDGNRKRSRRPLALAGAAVLMLAVLGGCGSTVTNSSTTSQASGSGPSGTITMGSQTPPTSIDPAIGNDDASTVFLTVLYDPLYRYIGQQAEPWLAKSAVPSDGNKTWTITIHSGVKFQDGNALTAQDVVYSWQRLLNLKQGFASLFLPIMSASDISASNSTTVVVHLARPFSPFPELLPYVFTLDSAAVKAHPANNGETWLSSNAAGSGPYEIVSWQPNNEYVLKANPKYWKGWSGHHPEEIDWKIMNSLSTRELAVASGAANMINWMNIQSYRSLRTNAKVRVSAAPTAETFAVVMNTVAGPTTNIWLRRAIVAAFPYALVRKQVFGGIGTPIGGPVPQNVSGADPALKPLNQNIALAKADLAKANLPAGGISLDYVYSAGLAEEQQLGLVLASTLKPLGITVHVVAQPWPTFSSNLASASQAPSLSAVYFQGFYDSPDSFLTPQFSDQSSGWEDGSHLNVPTINNLLKQAALATSPAQQNQDYIAAQQAIVNEAPAAFVVQVDTLRAASANLVWPSSLFGPTTDYYFTYLK